ncbi:MAG: hypothetical protein V7L00_11615 [Nostoc sp.]
MKVADSEGFAIATALLPSLTENSKPTLVRRLIRQRLLITI